MPKIQSHDQTTISYARHGEGPQFVVLVHGWMFSSAIFQDWLPLLDQSTNTFLVPDLRGTGDSGQAEGYAIADYAQDLLAVVDDANASSFVLVGHSMGGQIAQYFAAQHPSRVSGLMLINTVPASGVPLPDDATQLFRNSGENRQSQGTILDLACKMLQEDDKNKLLDDAGTIPAACISQAFDSWTSGGFQDELAKITAPTLVVATDDPFLPPDFLTQAVVQPIPHARLTYLPGPGHYPQVEKAQESAALFHAFLAGLSM